jgi:hypothetical protein
MISTGFTLAFGDYAFPWHLPGLVTVYQQLLELPTRSYILAKYGSDFRNK